MKKKRNLTPLLLTAVLLATCLAASACAVKGYYLTAGIALLATAGCVWSI